MWKWLSSFGSAKSVNMHLPDYAREHITQQLLAMLGRTKENVARFKAMTTEELSKLWHETINE